MKLWSGWAHTLRTKPSRRRGEGGGEGGGEKEVEGGEEGEGGKEVYGGEEGEGGGVSVSAESGGKKTEEDKVVENKNKVEQEEEEEEEEEREEHFAPRESSSAPRPTGITYSEMSNVGKMVKRILDQGRVEYLRDLGLCGFQTRYCDSDLSPECVMILATRKMI
jgi:Methyltransferase TRM13